EADDAFAACAGDAELGELTGARRGDPLRRRRQAVQLGERRSDRLAERSGEAAGDGGRGLHGNLLTENGAQAHLESVERARNPHAPIGFYQRAQDLVAGEMSGYDFGTGVQIEQIAHAV